MKKRTTRQALILLSAFAGTLALTGCVNQNQVDSMQSRLMQQEQQLQMLNSQLSGVQPAQADTWAQVQSLRQEMSSVRGQIDDFNNATASAGGLPGLAQRVNTHHSALQAIATQFDMNLNLDAPADPTATGMPPGMAGVPGMEGQQPSVPQGMPQGMPQTGQMPAQQPPAPPVQQPAQQPAQQPSSAQKDTATVLYDAGMKSFNARNYKQAFNSFRDFTDTYPQHRLVSNAWFWRGECNFQLGSFPAAALDYEQVISKYPSSGKAAASYLKQGMCFIKTGKKDAARFRLEELIKKFPKSPEATRAQQVLKENTK